MSYYNGTIANKKEEQQTQLLTKDLTLANSKCEQLNFRGHQSLLTIRQSIEGVMINERQTSIIYSKEETFHKQFIIFLFEWFSATGIDIEPFMYHFSLNHRS